MSKWLDSCLNIHHEVHQHDVHQVSLRVEVYTINGLRGCGVTFLLNVLFTFMESCGVLDVDAEIHLFCLHYSRINRSLTAFKNGWNNHPLSSEGYITPLQLWISGLTRELSNDWNKRGTCGI